MCDITIPTDFETLTTQGSGFYVSAEVDIQDISDSELNTQIEDLLAIDLNSDDDECGLPQTKVDFMYSIIAKLDSVSGENKTLFCEVMTELCSRVLNIAEGNCDQRQRNAVRIIFYFSLILSTNLEIACKKKAASEKSAQVTIPKSRGGRGKGKAKVVDDDENDDCQSFSLSVWRPKFLHILEAILALDESKIWTMGIVQESFLILLWKLPMRLLEEYKTDESSDSALKALCIKTIDDYAKRYSSCGGCSHLTTAIINSLATFEHMGPIISEIIKKVNGFMIAELMNEIGQMNMSDLAKSGNGPKNVGIFLVSFAEMCPDKAVQHLPGILQLIDCEVYQIRSAVIQYIGAVISYIHHAQSDESSPEKKVEVTDGEETTEKNTESLNRVRETLLSMLIERTLDNGSFTRAVVLKVWTSLVEDGSIPVRRIGSVAEVAVDRLFDRIAAVRKAAVGLLTALIECNPFNSNLNIQTFKSRAEELNKEFSDRVKVIREIVNGPLDSMINDIEKEGTPEADDGFESSDEVITDPDIVAIVAEKEYCNAAIELLTAVDQAIPKIQEMSRSKTLSDVTEALEFFSRAVNFNIQGAGKAFTDSFALIWHHDEAIRKECINAFRNVFLTDGATDRPRSLPSVEIADNLTGLVQRCGTSELASLEKIVGEVFKADYDSSVVQAIWNKIHAYSKEDSTVSDRSKQIAGLLKVIAIIAKCVQGIMEPAKIRLVTHVLSSELAKEVPDNSVISAAAQCFQTAPGFLSAKLSEDTKKALLDAAPCLRDVILGFWCPDDEESTRLWFGACEESMHALFHIHPSPDKVLASVIVPLYANLASTLSTVDGRAFASPSKLARILFVLGQGAICSLVFTEKIAAIAKKYNEEKYKAQAAVAEKAKGAHSNVSDAMEEEMGLVAAADAEHERTYMLVIEKQLVGDNILGKFHPLIAFVVANEAGTFSDPLLRETSILALCRFMSVSSEICELYLPLLFTIVEREKSAAVRTSVMIAVGDLSFRFPNSLEPWTTHMYGRLSDKDDLVRYNTLMTLTHLILNDMIKVKGQVSHMVLCLNDSCDKIRDLACLFFTELAKRSNNPVYNLMGDIISILSRGEEETATATVSDAESSKIRVLSEIEFQATMTFLLRFVGKDKQADSLLERLLTRISVATSQSQRRNLSFCISQLPVTEKGVKKMIEMIKLIKDALYDIVVFDNFKQCLARAKKSSCANFSKKATSTEGGASAESHTENVESQGDGAQPSTGQGSMKSITEEMENIMGLIRDLADGTSTVDIDFDSVIATVTKSQNPVNDENAGAPSTKRGGKKAVAKKAVTDASREKFAAVQQKKGGAKKKMQWSDDEDEGSDTSDTEVSDSEDVCAPAPIASKTASGGRVGRQPLKSRN